jgi:hypothetical protein
VESPFTQSGALIWLGALATLALYSILYRENPVYRAAEHIFVGLAAGYGLFVAWDNILFPKWYTPLVRHGQWPWSLAVVAALMYFTVFSKRFSWMSRLVLMTLMGLKAGLEFRKWAGRYPQQIGASFKPIFQPDFAPPYLQFDSILFVGTLLCVMLYFLFSFEQKNRAVRGGAAAGRWLMMIAFGAMFGSTVMARLSLFIGRLWFLFADWIHWIPKK